LERELKKTLSRATFSALHHVGNGGIALNTTGGTLNCSSIASTVFSSDLPLNRHNYTCIDGKSPTPPSTPPPATKSHPTPPQTNKISKGSIIGGIIAAVFGFLFFALTYWFLGRKKWKPRRKWKQRIHTWRAELPRTEIVEAPGDLRHPAELQAGEAAHEMPGDGVA
jgi:hypothetical protein